MSVLDITTPQETLINALREISRGISQPQVIAQRALVRLQEAAQFHDTSQEISRLYQEMGITHKVNDPLTGEKFQQKVLSLPEGAHFWQILQEAPDREALYQALILHLIERLGK